MDAHLDRRVVVGQHSNADGLVPRLGLFVDRTYHALVEVLDGLHLQLHIAVMTGLIAGLYMQEHEVLGLQVIESRLGLCLIVGVPQTCCTRYLDDIQAGIFSDALNKIYGRHHST